MQQLRTSDKQILLNPVVVVVAADVIVEESSKKTITSREQIGAREVVLVQGFPPHRLLHHKCSVMTFLCYYNH